MLRCFMSLTREQIDGGAMICFSSEFSQCSLMPNRGMEENGATLSTGMRQRDAVITGNMFLDVVIREQAKIAPTSTLKPGFVVTA